MRALQLGEVPAGTGLMHSYAVVDWLDAIFSYLNSIVSEEGHEAKLPGAWHNWLSCNAQSLQTQLARMASAALALPKEHTALKASLLSAACGVYYLVSPQLCNANTCTAGAGVKAQLLSFIAEVQNDAELDILVACSMAVQIMPSRVAAWRIDTLVRCLALLLIWQNELGAADIEQGQLQQLMALPLAAGPARGGSSSGSSTADIPSATCRIFMHQHQHAYRTVQEWWQQLDMVDS
jgi:hypothetical protein